MFSVLQLPSSLPLNKNTVSVYRISSLFYQPLLCVLSGIEKGGKSAIYCLLVTSWSSFKGLVRHFLCIVSLHM